MGTVLDGPLGTELARRGVGTRGRAWSATALREAPQIVEAIHRDYARAGATVHTANTFRTTPRGWGDDWRPWAERAVQLARRAVPAHHRVAGSIAPLEDCYRPDLSPPGAALEHRTLAEALAACGVDLLLCETFPHPSEALHAVRAAVATGVDTWLALTAGPQGRLMAPKTMRDAAAEAVQLGASAVLVNCVAASLTLPFVRALGGLGVPVGVYANAGQPHEGIGWDRPGGGPQRYIEHVQTWVEAGATLVGGCCGTDPDHIAAVATYFDQILPAVPDPAPEA